MYFFLQHPAICEFPSNQFYQGKLETMRSISWRGDPLPIWPRMSHPIVMCHVEGTERVLSVSTDEGNEQSKMNDKERDEAVCILCHIYFVHFWTFILLDTSIWFEI